MAVPANALRVRGDRGVLAFFVMSEGKSGVFRNKTPLLPIS